MAVIYIDVLFVVNLIVNYLLLRISCIFSGLKPNKLRIFLGGIAGACYAVLIFFPDFSVIHTTIYKFLVSMLIIAISSPFYSARSYIKTVFIFYAVSFTFGGCVLGVFYFSNIGTQLGAIYSNGVLYFNLPWTILAVSGVVFYGSVKLFYIVSKSGLRKGHFKKKIILYYKNRTTEITALLDTGNSLIDPITMSPVIVAEYKFLKRLFEKEMLNDLDRISTDNFDWIIPSLAQKGLATRLIPFSSVGKDNGLLLGFIPDKVEIHDDCGVKNMGNCVVAIYDSPLSKDNSFGALVNPYI